MKIIPLDSGADFPPGALERIVSRDDFSQLIVRRCPVLLVSPETMDKIYPPWKLRSYSEDCLRRRLNDFTAKIAESTEEHGNKEDEERLFGRINESIDGFWDGAKECRESNRGGMSYEPASGLYLGVTSEKDIGILVEAPGGKHDRTEQVSKYQGEITILLCLERIRDWSSTCLLPTMTEQDGFELLVAAVWFHEAAHAWLQTESNTYQSDWGYLLEESLAQAYAANGLGQTDPCVEQNQQRREDSFIRLAFSAQRFPYSAWAYWDRIDGTLLPAWRDSSKRTLSKCHRRRIFPYRRRWRNLVGHLNDDDVFENVANALSRKTRTTSAKQIWQLLAMSLLDWAVKK